MFLAAWPHRRDVSLLGCARRRRNLLGQLEDGRAALVLLLPQTQVRSFDVTIRDSAYANDRLPVWKFTEKKPPFAFDPGVPMVRQHAHILADSCAREGRLHRPHKQIRGDQLSALSGRGAEWLRRHANADVSEVSLPSVG